MPPNASNSSTGDQNPSPAIAELPAPARIGSGDGLDISDISMSQSKPDIYMIKNMAVTNTDNIGGNWRDKAPEPRNGFRKPKSSKHSRATVKLNQ
jgi:hypothetical protein